MQHLSEVPTLQFLKVPQKKKKLACPEESMFQVVTTGHGEIRTVKSNTEGRKRQDENCGTLMTTTSGKPKASHTCKRTYASLDNDNS